MRPRRAAVVLAALVLALLVAAVPQASAATTASDVPATSPLRADVIWASTQKVVLGFSDGTFRPGSTVDNRTMAAFLYRLRHSGAKAPACRTAPYGDVPRTSTSCGEISWLKAQKISTAATFSPTKAISRERAAIWLYRLAKASSACRATFSDVGSASASCPAVTWAVAQGLDNGPTRGTFRATAAMTRGTTATWLHRVADVLTPRIGADVSHPQCAAAGSSTAGPLPKGQAFGVVGVNAGKPTTTNSCLAAELAWAGKSTGGTVQKKVQLYVNTANPGKRLASVWPTKGKNRYGTCANTDSTACAYEYGRARAIEDTRVAGLPAPTSTFWWLDVENHNSWMADTRLNVAVLEGMADHLRSIQVAGVGLYSSVSLWREIVGTSVTSKSPLYALPSWLAGAPDLGAARRLCGAAPLTKGGSVRLTQYIRSGFDRDHSCV